MVRKILNFLNREVGGLHEAAYLLGFFTLLSQILALVRDRLLAGTFGASRSLDIYYAAFRIPDFIFISVGSMVSISVLIPFLADKMRSGAEEGKRFISTIFSFFFLLIIVVCAAAFFAVPKLNSLIFPGFSGQSLAQVTSLTRILLLSPILLGLSNLLGTLTQMHRRFFLYSASPIIYNISIIAGVLFLYPMFGLSGLAYGVIVGAFLHFAIQIPFILENGLFPHLSFKFDFGEIRRVLFMSLPRTFALGSDSISIIFILSIASLMAGGSIAIFTFSYNLQSVPLSIVGVSYSLAAFPILAKYFSAGEKNKFIEQMVVSARHVVFWSIPIATLFIVLRAQIVRTILGSGRFNWNDTRLTAAALAVFASSLIFQNLTLLFVRGYYAAGNTKKPFIAKFINAATTIGLGYVFMIMYQKMPWFGAFLENILRVQGVPGAIVLALPLGWSVGELLNTIALWLIFQKDFKNFSRPVLRTLAESLAASLAMGFASYASLNVFDKIFNLDTFFGIFLQGAISGTIGIAVVAAVLKILKSKELDEVVKTLKKKVWNVKIVGPDPSLTE